MRKLAISRTGRAPSGLRQPRLAYTRVIGSNRRASHRTEFLVIWRNCTQGMDGWGSCAEKFSRTTVRSFEDCGDVGERAEIKLQLRMDAKLLISIQCLLIYCLVSRLV
ncbi:hypothetical protein HBI56_140210 [Parastagonospora nodorum]|nr:hypothetical protein HBH51_114310 [Parastagonospora nodorum]KAH3996301.1 hypothetical protein HBI10_155680 [Parastagonospora nodorum]KAH4019094.1 hypothetical protein HBI13_130390 [Parastagonospora nodorum]KAH4295551.1 hypothetical protein HBI01_151870 [Parastagonospora nodorum]KAH4298103.1 hypothetical protein HBI02_161100 [Parastagonospora nodorum]